jgi:acyl carrier protein
VAEAAVVVTDGTITAYVVRHEGASAEDLRDVVAQRLPARLIPTGVVELTALATTSDGRIDRRRLPDAARCRRRAARDARDALLCRLFAEVLEQPDIGIDDEFFALGGNSLLATRLIGRLRSETGMQISIRSVFQYPTVAELTERWDEIASVSRPGLSRMKRS